MFVRWFEAGDEAGLTALVQAVTEQGGAIGWLRVPASEEVAAWRISLLNKARLAVAVEAGHIIACGAWSRYDAEPIRGMAEISKVMTHPRARRKGAARRVMDALIADAKSAGVEILTLELRGNNHGALQMYKDLEFTVTGCRPNAVAVGMERWHQILMHRDLRDDASDLILHGCGRHGPGST